MRFSIIIPSYLGAYQHAASNRPSKLMRAIDSCLAQTFKDFEVMVVADGCEETFNIVEREYSNYDNVDCLLIRKQPLWSGIPRNYGISKAQGDYIVYLDADDKLGTEHLSIIDNSLTKNNNPTWIWYNDLLMKRDGTHYERNILINERFQNGTSNICHRRDAIVNWNGSAYGFDDYGVVQQLLRYPNYMKTETPQYFVCHTQQGLDV